MTDDSRHPVPARPARAAAPIASSVRKAQVRAALFHRSEAIRIGRFILLEPLGAGAMGEIFAAYDEQLDRKVALKLVRSGSSVTVKADGRLLREAQTLAQVSHPNVVQIYEAGTYDGRLFIAMELVRGRTLTRWLRDAAQLPRAVRQREILRQFIAAGHGLEAAHAAGVAHRDFKPDNVLVGDDGRVRVVDFGLARALIDDQDTDPGEAPAANDIGRGATEVLAKPSAGADAAIPTPLVTGGSTIDHLPDPPLAPAVPRSQPRAASEDSGPRLARSSAPRLKAALRLTETGTVMGTPFFMAPEQMTGAIADRRSDQFSFCVALYHALYDAFPFSGRTLRELRDSMHSDELEFAAGVPVSSHLRRALHRGLSVDPAQRFPTMADLLAALAPRTRRRTWIAAAAGALAVALTAGFAMRAAADDPCVAAGAAIDTEWSIAHQMATHVAFLRSDQPFAASAWHGAKLRLDAYARAWRGEARAACEATHVERTQSAAALDKRVLCLDRGRRQLAAMVAELATGSAEAVERSVEAAGALPEIAACRRSEGLLLGIAPPPVQLVGEVAAARDRLARAATAEQFGRYDEALALARAVATRTERMGYAPLHAEALTQVARAMLGTATAATRAEIQHEFFEALTLAEAEHHDQLAAEIWSELVLLALRMDPGMAQAHEWWGQAYAWSRRSGTSEADAAGGAAGVDAARLQYLLGEIYNRESRYPQAAEAERRAIAAASRAPERALDLARYENALAKSLRMLDALDEAQRLHEHALAVASDALGAGHPTVISFQIDLGLALWKRGQLDRARDVLGAALASMPARDRESRRQAASIHSVLSEIDYAEGKLDSAADHGRQAVEIYRRALSPDHTQLADAYINLANVEIKRRDFEGALALYDGALRIQRRHLDADHFQIGASECGIAEALADLGRPDEAMPHLVEAERIFALGSVREPAFRAWALTVRGEILVAQRRHADAIRALDQAMPLFGDREVDPTNHAIAAFTLARALRAQGGDPARVRALAEAAAALFARIGPPAAADRADVARFLAGTP